MKMKKIDFLKPMELVSPSLPKYEIKYFDFTYRNGKEYHILLEDWGTYTSNGFPNVVPFIVDEFGYLNGIPYIRNVPQEVTRWYNVYKNGPGHCVYLTEEDAKKSVTSNAMYIETRSFTYKE
jgi:hypothetical protein